MHLYHEHAWGNVHGLAFTDHLLEVEDPQLAADILRDPHWRLATDAEVAAHQPAPPKPAKAARKAKS